MTLQNKTDVSLRYLYATTSVESIGDSFSRALLPIVAVSFLGLGADAVGIINSLGLLAFLFLSLPLGILADKSKSPVRLMMVGSLVRALATGLGFLLWLSGILNSSWSLAYLVGIALMMGISDVVFTAGQSLVIPLLVSQENLRPTYGKVQSLAQTGSALGPALLSGALMLVTAPVAWIGSAFLYLMSAVCQNKIQVEKTTAGTTQRKSSLYYLKYGVRELVSHHDLALITLSNSLLNGAIMAANTLLPVFALSYLQISTSMYAAVGIFGALAGIVGSIWAATITRRFGLKNTRLGAGSLYLAGAVMILFLAQWLLPLMPIVWISLWSAVGGFSGSIIVVSGADLAPRLVSPDLLGTTLGAARTLTLGIMPIAALGFGFLASVLGLNSALLIWVITIAIAMAPNLWIKYSN